MNHFCRTKFIIWSSKESRYSVLHTNKSVSRLFRNCSSLYPHCYFYHHFSKLIVGLKPKSNRTTGNIYSGHHAIAQANSKSTSTAFSISWKKGRKGIGGTLCGFQNSCKKVVVFFERWTRAVFLDIRVPFSSLHSNPPTSPSTKVLLKETNFSPHVVLPFTLECYILEHPVENNNGASSGVWKFSNRRAGFEGWLSWKIVSIIFGSGVINWLCRWQNDDYLLPHL